jgi:hypothetical protein
MYPSYWVFCYLEIALEAWEAQQSIGKNLRLQIPRQWEQTCSQHESHGLNIYQISVFIASRAFRAFRAHRWVSLPLSAANILNTSTKKSKGIN